MAGDEAAFRKLLLGVSKEVPAADLESLVFHFNPPGAEAASMTVPIKLMQWLMQMTIIDEENVSALREGLEEVGLKRAARKVVAYEDAFLNHERPAMRAGDEQAHAACTAERCVIREQDFREMIVDASAEITAAEFESLKAYYGVPRGEAEGQISPTQLILWLQQTNEINPSNIGRFLDGLTRVRSRAALRIVELYAEQRCPRA
mmetsp:Transcript_17408/g.67624  ORF Transcript_17408/g.67624 Transcript_17408/m.67624 type:complete len:204 (+) Transcript_17408:54-665(+)|eukprot:CAMPEP_0114623200 /NCGR_PEP_ID=MMETSP0168-20121206/10124_1 /TAXON_ID=95228 ORGANISM="Vannella sp., Strain DIVA3 517/6/12" /NCGR_SAMPLE_ID=MMETSP0168 /ASSEMBLY_ACC=CAM_ASM_000044 /LENGTH=203 /DNA_ID=CAMNT_0001834427 /DNA_START=12 /DNA_END=623 /DNA_ORIENTATION=-